jgi:ADP-heptose:LPS heptosyltransferase
MKSSKPVSLDLDNRNYLKFFTNTIVWLLKNLLRIFAKSGDGVTVISFSNIGDTVFTIPALKKLSKIDGCGRITLVTQSNMKFILQKEFPDFGFIFVEKSDFILGGKFPSTGLIKKTRALRNGTTISFSVNPQSIFLMLFSGGNKFYGIAREAYKKAFDNSHLLTMKSHLSDIYFDAVDSFKKVDREIADYGFPLSITKGDEVIITPFTGWDAKMWGIENMIELADRLNKDRVVNFVVEKGKLENRYMEVLKLRGIKVTEPAHISEYEQLLKNAALLIGNDTGPVYIARYYGIPTIAIFGPTNPDYCRHNGEEHIMIYKVLDCSPVDEQYCKFDAGRTCPHRNCLQTITVEEVELKVLSILEKQS